MPAKKSPDAFRTISEVADWLGVNAHVLRFWESKFSQIKPVKRAGGRRYYRKSDMELLGGIKQLLHEDGLTIKGAQKVLRERGVKAVAALSKPVDDLEAVSADADAAVQAIDKPSGAETASVDGVTETDEAANASEPTVAASAASPDASVPLANGPAEALEPEEPQPVETATVTTTAAPAKPQTDQPSLFDVLDPAGIEPKDDGAVIETTEEVSLEAASDASLPEDALLTLNTEGVAAPDDVESPDAGDVDLAASVADNIASPDVVEPPAPFVLTNALPEEPEAEAVDETASLIHPEPEAPDAEDAPGVATSGAELSTPEIAPLPGSELTVSEALERMMPGQIPEEALAPILIRAKALRVRMENAAHL